MLHGKCWRPGIEDMVSAKREALNVASLLDVSPLLGPEANKEKFMKDVASASVIHIGNLFCVLHLSVLFTTKSGLLTHSHTMTPFDALGK